MNKVLNNIEEAIVKSGLKDGMTISFHHHFRNGDVLVNEVVKTIGRLGIKNIKLAASSLIDVHKEIIPYIEDGTITSIETSGLRGELGDFISKGKMDTPVIFKSHGLRAADISTGKVKIDVAFLVVPACDTSGNANGYALEGSDVLCGSLGYAMVDAKYANKTVLVTNHFEPYPFLPAAILENDVDYIVTMDNIGDSSKIVSGATRYTKNPKELLIAENCAKLINELGLLKPGFSMQMGTGGSSLATARYLEKYMEDNNIVADFALGGITEQIVKMHEKGLIKQIMDVQSFDLGSAASIRDNTKHHLINAVQYASPLERGAAVNKLDFVILSALEVDTKFNVNVLVGSDGIIRGAIGGHQDTAAGAKVTIVTTPLTRGRISTISNKIQSVTTPGSTIDVVVTEMGIAINPNRKDLMEALSSSKLPITSIEKLAEMAEKKIGVADDIRYTDKVVGLVRYRDGSTIDKIYQVEE